MTKRMSRKEADRKMALCYSRMVAILKAIESPKVQIVLIARIHSVVKRDAMEALEVLGGRWKSADGMGAQVCQREESNGSDGIEWEGYDITLFARAMDRRKDVMARFAQFYEWSLDDLGLMIGRPLRTIGVG